MSIIQQESTNYLLFTTRQFSSGAPFALSTTGVVSVYEENNATQITDGVTLTRNYDSVTGLNQVSVVAASSNGYEAGKRYYAVITAGTVDSVSVVGEVVGDIGTVESDSQKALRTFSDSMYITEVLATQTGVTNGNAINLSAQVDAQVPDDSLIGTVWVVKDATDGRTEEVVVVDYASTGTLATIERLGVVGSSISFTPVAGDSVWRVGVVDRAKIDTIKTDTAATLVDTAQIGAAGAGLTSVPWNASWDAEVESEVIDAINASTRFTGIEGATFATGTDSLEAIRNRGDAAWTGGAGSTLTAGAVANAVWDEATSGHVGAGSFGAEVQSHALSSELPTNIGALAITTGGDVTAGTVSDKTGYALTQSFPTNFDAMSISTGGDVTAGTVSDKTGYTLTQNFPSNFDAISISTAGVIGTVSTVTTLTNKTGFTLGSTGLNAVTLAEPSAVPSWGAATAVEGISWNVAFNRNRIISNSTQITLRNDADSTDLATAAVTATTSSVTRNEYS